MDFFGTDNAPSVDATPAEPAPEPAPAAQEPSPAPEPQPAPEAAQPNVAEQIAALREEIRSQREPEQPAQPTDLYDSLLGAAGTGEPEGDQYGPQGYGNPEPAAVPNQGQPQGQADPFDEIIRERVAEEASALMYPVVAQIQADRDRAALEQVADRHPEFRSPEVQQAVAGRLAPLVERYGTERILVDPVLVEQALVVEKAARATANEVPAEQAASQGATLETNASASAPQDQPTPEEIIKQGILSAGAGGDVFT